MKRVAVIGAGLIGAPVIEAIARGEAGEWELAAVLTRSGKRVGEIKTLSDASAFFTHEADLVIDAAGPGVLGQLGEQALMHSDLWTVNAAALADSTVYQLLEQTGREHGHRLRIVSGAIAGLDGVAAIALDSTAAVEVSVDLAPSAEGRKLMFSGSAREASTAYPEHVNVAAATALASHGLDKTQVEVIQPALEEGRSIRLNAQSHYGKLNLQCVPGVVPAEGIHLVAASIVAALKQEQQTIWV